MQFVYDSSETISCEIVGLSLMGTLAQISSTNDNQTDISWFFDSQSDSNHKPRRPRATLRERQRMAQVNNAFDNLRRVVPRGHMTEYQRLSKIATLRLAIQYIKAMSHMLGKPLLPNHQLHNHRRSRLNNTATNKSSTFSDNATKKYSYRTNKSVAQSSSSSEAVASPCFKSTGRTIRSRRHLDSEIQNDPSDSYNYGNWADLNQEVNKTLMLFGYEPKLNFDTRLDNNAPKKYGTSNSIVENSALLTTVSMQSNDYNSIQMLDLQYYEPDLQFGSSSQTNHMTRTQPIGSSYLPTDYCQWCEYQHYQMPGIGYHYNV